MHTLSDQACTTRPPRYYVGSDTSIERCTRRLTAPWPCQPDNESSECQHQQVGQCPEDYGCRVDRRSGTVHLSNVVLYHVFKLRRYLFYAQTNLPLSSGYFHGRATLPIDYAIVCIRSVQSNGPGKTQSLLGGVVHVFRGSQGPTENACFSVDKGNFELHRLQQHKHTGCMCVCVFKFSLPVLFLVFPLCSA